MQFLPLILLMIIASTIAIIWDRRREAQRQAQTVAPPSMATAGAAPGVAPASEAPAATATSFSERLVQVWRSRKALYKPKGALEGAPSGGPGRGQEIQSKNVEKSA